MLFTPFPKIPRLSREVVVTEKLDGTNASICIAPVGDDGKAPLGALATSANGAHWMVAGSRTRWLDTSNSGDNYGFAKWAAANADELFALGVGHHFGEWWGLGVQRNYGLTEKRFSLFNTGRWYDPTDCEGEDLSGRTAVPACCHVVPQLLRGPFDSAAIEVTLDLLRERGSVAAPGFMKPEGVIVYHVAAGVQFKKTLDGDAVPKGLAVAA